MNDHDKKLIDKLFDRICDCVECGELELRFTVHRTQGGWLDMTVLGVDGDAFLDLRRLLEVFGDGAEGGFVGGRVHVAEDGRFALLGRVGRSQLVQVTFRGTQTA